MAKKFNLAALVPEMEAVSNSDTPRITMIPIAELRPNSGNFYDTSNIDDLVDSIELNGLLEPLCVFRRGQGTGSYVIFSGHRRFKALRMLYEKSGFKKWTEVPCIVYPDPHDANREMVMLIHANSTGRVLSNWEKAQQARRLKEALVAMREGGAELPGRIRDLVAEEMQMSSSKLARLDAIQKNLTHRKLRNAWKRGEIGESVAYELSKLLYYPQTMVVSVCERDGIPFSQLKIKDITQFADGKNVESDTGNVSNLDTGDGLSVSGGAAATSPGGRGEEDNRGAAAASPSESVSNSDTWRRCLVDEPDEGQLVLVVEPDIPSMPDVCVYRGGQFVDGIGRGDAMEVKSFWLWLPLPPLPWKVSEE